MKMQWRLINKIAVVEPIGRFDAHNAPAVAETLAEALNSQLKNAVVNLGKVNFMDSTALATLVQGMKRCRQADGDLHLCCLQQPVRIIFELTRLDKAFRIFETEIEALNAFSV
jgi:anti-sigma B factor antagonist